MNTRTRLVSGDIGILPRVLGNGRRKMSSVLARHILTLGFDEDDQKRMGELAERNQLGRLSGQERAELLEYVRAADVLALLHSQARLALKSRAKV
jgi:hypothetical protein